MSKHTPGDWYVAGRGQDAAIMTSGDSPSGTICVACCNSGYANNEANAHLIAAAPDLLEACKKALVAIDWWENEHGCCRGATDDARAAVNAAIAKAEGR